MEKSDLLLQIAPGEDSTHQFKFDIRNGQSLAAEMAAFSNSDGGTIYIGVADDCTTLDFLKKMFPASIKLSVILPANWYEVL